jgi:uncharacterized membrane protein
MKLRSEIVGAFIDAVFAIAVTILALEIPSQFPNGSFDFKQFAGFLVEYGVAFFLIFSFWIQHRRIKGVTETVGRIGLLTNALILMLVCLIPRATKLVFEYGGNVALGNLSGSIFSGTDWDQAELVDLLYVAVVVLTDLCILLLLCINGRNSVSDDLADLRASKRTVTLLVLIVTASSFLLPVENRFFLLIMPLVLFFEEEISRFDLRRWKRR